MEQILKAHDEIDEDLILDKDKNTIGDCQMERSLRPALIRVITWISKVLNKYHEKGDFSFLKDPKDKEAGSEGIQGVIYMSWATIVMTGCYLQRNILFKNNCMDYYILQFVQTSDLIRQSKGYLMKMDDLMGDRTLKEALLSQDIKTPTTDALCTVANIRKMKEILYDQAQVFHHLNIFKPRQINPWSEYQTGISLFRNLPYVWIMPALDVAYVTKSNVQDVGPSVPLAPLTAKFGSSFTEQNRRLKLNDHVGFGAKYNAIDNKLLEDRDTITTFPNGRLMDIANATAVACMAGYLATDPSIKWKKDMHQFATCTNDKLGASSVDPRLSKKLRAIGNPKEGPFHKQKLYLQERGQEARQYQDVVKSRLFERAERALETYDPRLVSCDCENDKKLKDDISKAFQKKPGDIVTSVDNHVKICSGVVPLNIPQEIRQEIRPKGKNRPLARNVFGHPHKASDTVYGPSRTQAVSPYMPDQAVHKKDKERGGKRKHNRYPPISNDRPVIDYNYYNDRNETANVQNNFPTQGAFRGYEPPLAHGGQGEFNTPRSKKLRPNYGTPPSNYTQHYK